MVLLCLIFFSGCSATGENWTTPTMDDWARWLNEDIPKEARPLIIDGLVLKQRVRGKGIGGKVYQFGKDARVEREDTISDIIPDVITNPT